MKRGDGRDETHSVVARARSRSAAVLCLAVLVAGVFAAASCGDSGTPGLTPGKLDADAVPVTFTQPSSSPMASGVMGQGLFSFKVDNASHCDLSIVKFGAVLFDGDGKRIPGDPQEVGLAGEVGDIHPGETYECKFTTGNANVSRAVVVLKEVVYVFVPEGKSNAMFRVPMKWTNTAYEAQVAVAAPK
ncbi:MAG: hypothetical protein K8T90_19005 [Planctomycetes bacterium]|nr:hypothetical protein [Planctomycetota bacterium]